MKIAAILPTHNLWGGVKRFLEIGNRCISRGHQFTIITPHGQRPTWFPFQGEVLGFDDIHEGLCDVAFVTETSLLNQLLACRARVPVFYHVLQHENLRPVLQHPEIVVFVNSSNLHQFDSRRYGIETFKAIGGVDTRKFTPGTDCNESKQIVMLTYGRLLMKRKGTRFVVSACERLYRKGFDIRLLLFDSPINQEDRAAALAFKAALPFEFILDHPVERTNEIFSRADIFASAEKNAGWANTCAEAMACGLPVVATASGSRDILIDQETGLVVRRNSWSVERAIKRLIQDPSLRHKLGENARLTAEKYDWNTLTDQILDYLNARIS